MTEHILGYEVETAGPRECADAIVRWIVQGDRCRTFACINPHTYARALKGERVSRALADADWLVPDGAGMVLASKILGGRLRNRVTGFDVFSGVLERLNLGGPFRIFLFGSTSTTLAAIQEKMRKDYPNLVVAGVLPDPAPGLQACVAPFPPMYTPEHRDSILRAITAARPDVLWVGMTAPKQELWLLENRAALGVKFAGAVGAVFDFYIGSIKRSTPFFMKHSLEWLAAPGPGAPSLMAKDVRLRARLPLACPPRQAPRAQTSPGGRAILHEDLCHYRLGGSHRIRGRPHFLGPGVSCRGHRQRPAEVLSSERTVPPSGTSGSSKARSGASRTAPLTSAISLPSMRSSGSSGVTSSSWSIRRPSPPMIGRPANRSPTSASTRMER